MNTNKHELKNNDLVYQVVGCAIVENICDEHIGQVINYLKISGCALGLILNFKHSKLEWKRVIYTEGEASQIK